MVDRKFNVKQKGVEVKLEKTQQQDKTEQYRQNRLFGSNQKRLFNELEGTQRESLIPDAEESGRFWSDVEKQSLMHRENTDWLRKLENEFKQLTVQDDIHIEIKKLRKHVRKIQN